MFFIYKVKLDVNVIKKHYFKKCFNLLYDLHFSVDFYKSTNEELRFMLNWLKRDFKLYTSISVKVLIKNNSRDLVQLHWYFRTV